MRYLPEIAFFSKGSIATNSAVGFYERINSAADLAVTGGCELLSNENVNTTTVLHMGRAFMEHMRKHHPGVSKQQFNISNSE